MNKPFEVYTNVYGRLKELGLELNDIVDVGCHKGTWSERMKKIYPNANYYLVDATDVFKEELEKIGNFYHAYVGQHSETRTFYKTKDVSASTGSSLYKENSNTTFVEEEIFTQTLSEVLPDEHYDLIKMDVQGAELEIIEGSLELFQKTKWVQLECPVFENNVGAPKFEHYINYMSNCGFRVFDIDNIYYNQRLMGIDFLFANKNLPKQIETEGTTLIYKQ